MDFELSTEQTLLKDSIERWARDRYGDLAQIDASRAQPNGFNAATWRELADLGLLGLPFEEAVGGMGGGAVETMVVMTALGSALAPEPYMASIILGGSAVDLAGDLSQRRHLLSGLSDGSLRLAFAHSETQARYDLDDVASTAARVSHGYRLEGQKILVLNADSAEFLIVSARMGGSRRDRDGISLFLVPTTLPGVTITPYPTQDGGRAATVNLTGVQLPANALLGPLDGASSIIAQVIGRGIAAVAAEAVGAMDALLALTVEHLKTRRQFGAAIGSFQALQHRAVDMLTATEQARSMALYATMMSQSTDAEARQTALSAAKIQINRSARLVAQLAVQLHGGIGMTMAYRGAHYFRRLTMIEFQFGDTAHHLRALT
jgi:alkylation response protein AidB-like acyl-CoA dehydrogenase